MHECMCVTFFVVFCLPVYALPDVFQFPDHSVKNFICLHCPTGLKAFYPLEYLSTKLWCLLLFLFKYRDIFYLLLFLGVGKVKNNINTIFYSIDRNMNEIT